MFKFIGEINLEFVDRTEESNEDKIYGNLWKIDLL